jgi:hypothetical protein
MGAAVGQNFSAARCAERHKEQGRIVSLEYAIQPQRLAMTHFMGCKLPAVVVAVAVSAAESFQDLPPVTAAATTLLIPRRINNIQRHRQEEIRNQNR